MNVYEVERRCCDRGCAHRHIFHVRGLCLPCWWRGNKAARHDLTFTEIMRSDGR